MGENERGGGGESIHFLGCILGEGLDLSFYSGTQGSSLPEKEVLAASAHSAPVLESIKTKPTEKTFRIEIILLYVF